MDDLTNILKDDELNEEQLKKYLSGKAAAGDAHAVEKNMAGDEFVNDAVEGLQSFSSQDKLDEYVNQLNRKLHQQLTAGKHRKEKRSIKNLPWVILAVIIILLLSATTYYLIKLYQSRQAENKHPGAVSARYKNAHDTFFM